MKFEMKLKLFSGFLHLVMLVSGGLTFMSLREWDLVLLGVSLVLGMMVIQLSIILGFIEGLIEEGP